MHHRYWAGASFLLTRCHPKTHTLEGCIIYFGRVPHSCYAAPTTAPYCQLEQSFKNLTDFRFRLSFATSPLFRQRRFQQGTMLRPLVIHPIRDDDPPLGYSLRCVTTYSLIRCNPKTNNLEGCIMDVRWMPHSCYAAPTTAPYYQLEQSFKNLTDFRFGLSSVTSRLFCRRRFQQGMMIRPLVIHLTRDDDPLLGYSLRCATTYCPNTRDDDPPLG